MAEEVVKRLDDISDSLGLFRRELSLYICKASMQMAGTYPGFDEDIMDILINNLINSAARDAIEYITIRYRLSTAILEREPEVSIIESDIKVEDTVLTVDSPSTSHDFV